MSVVWGEIAQSTNSAGVVIAGSAGVGKTRLAREALGLAGRSGRQCRWITATASARSVPLGAFAEFATALGPDPLLRVQEVIDALIGTEPSMTMVVGIDDAHLLDEQSALVVHQLVQRQSATVVLTHRSGEVAPDAIASLWKDGHLPRIDLQPLASVEVAELLARVLGGEVESSSAERLWRYTQGNVLYLRQLIADEAVSGRLSERSGVWIWDGEPAISPSLRELIESNIGRRPGPVIEVLDIVAVADPVELPVLLHLTPATMVDEATECGLINVDTTAQVARLAHPMFGEVRRATAGPVRLQALRGRVAAAIGQLCEPSPVQTVRRAVLMMESDVRPDPVLLQEATTAATQLSDMDLAVRLAHAATQSGGGRSAQLGYALALSLANLGAQGETQWAELAATATDDAERAYIGTMRAGNLGYSLGRPAAADRELDAAQQAATACGLTNTFNALRANFRGAQGHAQEAIDLASGLLGAPDVEGIPAMLAKWALVVGLGDTGQIDRLAKAAADGYALARTTSNTSHFRFGLGMFHVQGLRLAGAIDESHAAAIDLRPGAQYHQSALATTAALIGCTEMAGGDLPRAQKWLRESVAQSVRSPRETFAPRQLAGQWLATALAMSGHVEEAQQVFAQTPDLLGEYRYWEAERLLAQAWIHAASGIPSKATQLATEAASRARSLTRPAVEVFCLQTATQFGDSSTAGRLAELSSIVQGPRVGAAAAHSAALRDRDGDGLRAASQQYEAFGDRIAAADAAAQAAVAHRGNNRRGSALACSTRADALAKQCGGASTPALGQATQPLPLTAREREIAALIGVGLSNREVAERLTVSARTVETHIYRAMAKTGVANRDQLAALLSQPTPAAG
jgi:DNA-binding CsgD family transcriptional regulator